MECQRVAGMVSSEIRLTFFRIVEFSSRDEAQQAIATLSNTQFMGRQIFIREVFSSSSIFTHNQDREQEPRFSTGGGGHRGGFGGGYGGYPRGGFGGGYGGGGHGGPHGADIQGRQIYIGNVFSLIFIILTIARIHCQLAGS